MPDAEMGTAHGETMQTQTATTTKYVQCDERQIPGDVRFDVPRRHQGQTVEIAYGGNSRYEHDEGAPFKRVTDAAAGKVAYYKLAK